MVFFVPVATYLFLQGFGTNEYKLPLLYQEEIPEELLAICPELSAPYSLDARFLGVTSDLPLLLDVRLDSVDFSFVGNEIRRIEEYFGYLPVTHVVASQYDFPTKAKYELLIEDMQEFTNCQLLQQMNKSFMVLVDKQGVIRSTYSSDKKQEFDRLITELEILNKFN